MNTEKLNLQRYINRCIFSNKTFITFSSQHAINKDQFDWKPHKKYFMRFTFINNFFQFNFFLLCSIIGLFIISRKLLIEINGKIFREIYWKWFLSIFGFSERNKFLWVFIWFSWNSNSHKKAKEIYHRSK